MSLTLDTTPATVGLVKNTMKYKISTDNLKSTTGAKFAQPVTINNTSGGPADGQTWTLEWTDADGVDQSLTLTFKTTPTANTHIKTIGGGSVDTWATTYLLPSLQKQYYLNRDYIISITSSSSSSVTFKIEARETGESWDITFSGAPTSLSYGATTNGADDVFRSNFKVLLKIFMENTLNSEEYEKIADLDLDVDNTTEETTAFIQNILKGAMTKALEHPVADIPDFNETAITFCANILKRYKVYYAESYGDTPAAQDFSQDDVRHVLFGGQKENIFPLAEFVTNYFSSGTGKYFLTNQPTTVFINKIQHNYLFCYIPDQTGHTVRCQIQYEDGSTSNHNIFTAVKATANIAIIPVGYNQIDIDSLATVGKTVTGYKIFVSGTLTTRVQTFKLWPDYYNFRRNRYYLFQNSLGGFDSLWATGIELKTVEGSGNVNLRFDVDNTSMSADNKMLPHFIVNNSQYQDAVQISTGPKPKEYIDHLREMLNSGLIFEQTSDKYLPCYIVEKKIELYDDTTRQYMATFTIAKAYSNKA